MKDTTKVALQAAGIVAGVAGAYYGVKIIRTKAFGQFAKKTADTVVDASSELTDAAKEVVDEVKDSE